MSSLGRLQKMLIGLGSNKQADIVTASSTFNVFRQLNDDVPYPMHGTETDKDEIGKGNEFIREVFLTADRFNYQLRKYSSSEFTTWAWGGALGNVAYASTLYTIDPIDPGTTLELPYTSLVAQLPAGGSTSFDELYYGCVVEEVMTTFKYGPGRQSSETNVTLIGTGQFLSPSVISLSPSITEHNLLSGSMAITINGIDYVAGTGGVGAKDILTGAMGWKNNVLVDLGYFPGSGIQNGAAIAGRFLIGNRVPTLNFEVLLEANSTEFAKLLAQTSGDAVITLTHDSSNYVTWTYPKVSFSMVERKHEDGLVAVAVTCAVQDDGSTGYVLQVTAKNPLTTIFQ